MSAQLKSSPSYRTWQLKQEFLIVAGIRTAIYRNKHKSSSPTWLFLHGISGDHHGLMPLAYELRHEVNIVLIELPGHGLSDIPENASIEWLEEWSVDLLKTLNKKKIIIDKVISHSFSCIPATTMIESYKGSMVFMNMVARPAWFYAAYAHGISYFRAALAWCINFVPFSFLRGVWLLQVYNRETISIIYWLATHTVYSHAQARYQMQLSNQLGRIDIFAQKKLRYAKYVEILCGKQDNFSAISPDQLRPHLPNAVITVHEGGHLLPIERAAYIAKILIK